MDRRQLGEEIYRQKFETFGLSERFDFIRREWSKDHDKRFWARCKNCGAEFLSYNTVFKGRQNHLICANCGIKSDGGEMFSRSKQADIIAEYYIQGHSVKETAEHFGIEEWRLNNLVKERKISNGRQWQTAANENRIREGKKKIIEIINAKGFEYLGGYENKYSKIKLRCLKCGHEIERTVEAIKDGKTVCPECKKAETRERQEQDRQKRALEAEQRKRKQEAERKQKELQLQHERDQKLDEVFTCKICGKEYTPRQYMGSAGLTLFSNVGYCSAACKRKKEHRDSKECKKKRGVRENHRHRARKYGCEYDPTVTLERLIERDGLRCAICGEMCDPNDTSWSKFSGPLSPSIDHIIPMAKGGGHIWNNVQVAHIICNSYKGDSEIWKSSNSTSTR